MKKITNILLTAATLAVLSFTGCSKKNDSTKVRIGMLTGHTLPVIALENGYFKEQGLDNVELYYFGAGPAEIEAYTSGNLDIIHTGDIPAFNGINNGLSLRFIGTYDSSTKTCALVVRDDANIKSYADLKGKKISTPFGTYIHALAYEYLEAGGLTGDDVEIINLSCADGVNALRQKDVDAAVLWQPYVARAAATDGISIFSYTDEFRTFVCPISASPEYIEKNPETVKKALAALDKAAKWIEANQKEASQIAADYYRTNDSESIYIGLQGRDQSVKLTDEKVAAIKKAADINLKFGVIKKAVNVDGLLRQDLTENLK